MGEYWYENTILANYAITVGQSVTLSYSGGSTTNMTGNNDAATLNLDDELFSVIAAKGGSNLFPGLNKNSYVALYYNANGSNTITISIASGYTIDDILITFTASDYNNVGVTVGGNAVTDTDSSNTTFTCEIDASSFVITNANTSNVQVRISSIVIKYSEDN